MNAHALHVLEFAEVLERVALRAASASARERLRTLRPLREPERVRAELGRVAETLRELPGLADMPPPFPEAGAPLAHLAVEGAILDPAAVRDLHDLLVASRLLSDRLRELEASRQEEFGEGGAGEDGSTSANSDPAGAELPALGALRSALATDAPLESTLDRIVDEQGEVRDRASPALRSIRSRIRAARGKVVQRLDALLSGLPERYRVPDGSVSVRDGRYVIPVRREGRGEVGGVVHGESGTGATLFVEPPLAIQARVELHELEREEAAEIQRILRDATGRLRGRADDLGRAFEALVDFDTLHARARTASGWGAHLPEVVPGEHDRPEPVREQLRIRGGRHPLLIEQGVRVVPFDLDLDPDERAVVISGPNTGGKTVLLKAVGLTHLLTQSGILPPVGPGTRLPVLADVFADIGDEQSLTASLSTFAAHLANTREILEGAGAGTLVLVDEMGTGTDPAEGAALARALLEHLVEGGARALVTSHLGDLKRLDREGSGIVNASLLFDPDRIAPTYRFRKGRPGRSYGLAIARGLGLPAEVVDRAEAHLDSGELRLETLLETLESRERELATALAEADEARREAGRLRDELSARSEELEERERTASARAREEARQLLLDAREEVEEAIRQLRGEAAEAGLPEAAGLARGRVEAAARALGEEGRRDGGGRRGRRPTVGVGGGSEAARPLIEGAAVRLRETGARGVVRAMEEGRVTVEVGGLRLDLPREAVEVTEPSPGKVVPTGGGGWTGPDLPARMEADLRGLRVDQVQLELGRALDAAILGNLTELRVIHGLGTGAVKARVRELLSGDPRVEGMRPGVQGEGGAGVTVAVLR